MTFCGSVSHLVSCRRQDELSEGVRSLVEVNSRVQALIGELEDACRNIEVSVSSDLEKLQIFRDLCL